MPEVHRPVLYGGDGPRSHPSNGSGAVVYPRLGMAFEPTFHRPSAILAPYVAYFFALEGPAPEPGAPPHRVQVLPVPHPQLVFSFGDEAQERRMGGSLEHSPGYAVTGYMTRAIEYLAPGRLGVMMAGLHPWGLRPFLAGPPPVLIDANVLLTSLFDRVEPLERRVRASETMEQRLRHIETFLLSHLQRPSLDQPVVDAVDRIVAARGKVRVQELADEAALGRRHFLRRFREGVGIEPRFFLQLVRFQAVFEAMDRQVADPDWATIAADAGYSDQSHLINAFKAFTGMSPAAYHKCLRRSDVGLDFDAHIGEDDPARRTYV